MPRLMRVQILILIIIVACFGIVDAADWTNCWQNERNDREEINIKLPLKVAWQREHRLGSDNPVFMNGKVYLLYLGGFLTFKAYINEIDVEKGMVAKKYFIANIGQFQFIRMMGYKGQCYISVVKMAKKKDKFYMLVDIFAFDLQKKKVVWTFKNTAPFTMGNMSEASSWLTVANDKLILACLQIRLEPKLYCFNTQDGQLLWKTKEPKGEIDSTMPVIAEGKVLVSTASIGDSRPGHIAALDLNTGKVIWDNELTSKDKKGVLGAEKYSNAIVKSKYIYQPLHQYLGTSSMQAINIENGSTVWDSGGIFGSVIYETSLVDEKYIYISGYKENITKLDRTTGRKIWQKDKFDAKLLLQGIEWICFSTKSEGKNELVFLSKKDGSEMARYPLSSHGEKAEAAFISDVTPVGNNRIMIGIEDGTYYLLEGAK